MTTAFLRLLKSEDKESALASSIASIRSGASDPATVFVLEPSKFTKVPNTPFAYWIDDELRDLFEIPLSSECILEHGASSKDDSRFLRTKWEISGQSIHNKWKYFIKGGMNIPFFYEPDLVINWGNDAMELEAALLVKYTYLGNDANWVIHRECKYGEQGITWPRRPHHRGFFSIVPRGCYFSDNGPMLFCKEEWSLVGYLNSELFKNLIEIVMPRGTNNSTQTLTFDIGYVGSFPFIDFVEKQKVIANTKDAYESIRSFFSENDETSIFFTNRETLHDVKSIQEKINDAIFNNDILISGNRFSKPTEDAILFIDEETYSNSNIGKIIGLCFGRFDIRIFRDLSIALSLPDAFAPFPVCPPAMLIGTDGLPAQADNIASEAWLRARPNAITLPPEPARSKKITAADYPLDIPWDGILVDDSDDPRDILARLRATLQFLHGDKAEEKERELCTEIGLTDLREYLRKPSLFFDAHLKRYSKSRRKAPIYWPLQTRDGSYTIWLYYPRLTADTLYACSNILEDKLKLERRKLEMARDDLAKSESKADRLIVEELTDFTSALAEMKEEIDRVAGLPFKPDLDDGVQITASPLWRLFRHPAWQKELKATWEKLEEGDYDWAHMSYSIWPERVREKCRQDRSLAIAHGLEDICEQKAPEVKVAGKKRGRKPKAASEADLDFEENE